MSVVDDDDKWPLVPQRCEVKAESPDDLALVAKVIEARYYVDPPAWRLFSVAGTVDGYQQSLLWCKQRDVNWPRRDFDVRDVRWVGSHLESAALAEFTDVKTQQRMYRLRRGDRIAEVDLEWGCYAALSEQKRNVLYVEPKAVLVPLHARLPSVFATGLTLCSGFSPRVVRFVPELSGPKVFLRYRDVPRPLAELVAGKLDQQPQFVAPSEATS